RVACYSEPYASHAEYNFIPKNLFVKIPENVSFEDASFVGLGAIAMNAIRVANLTFGENVAVIGLGLLGQLTVQMLKAFGCKVIGIDISASKAKMALEAGCDKTAVIGQDDIPQAVLDFTSGTGADAVIIMAGSQDNKPIELASEISRDHGRIVACGMISLDVPRQDFFKKELSVIVSRATGPGKFDPLYESKGIDYPLPYVRWTTQRNMEYFLTLISHKKVNVKGLISHRFTIDNALDAYDMILKGKEPYLGVLLEYPKQLKKEAKSVKLDIPGRKKVSSHPVKKVGVALIGAGLHANTGILPSIKKIKNIELVCLADADGYKAQHTAGKYGFKYCVSDYKE
ncbi:MAG: zinc-binding dehydrogenase, partial [Candidatus Margulisiibacteriota bacterium]